MNRDEVQNRETVGFSRPLWILLAVLMVSALWTSIRRLPELASTWVAVALGASMLVTGLLLRARNRRQRVVLSVLQWATLAVGVGLFVLHMVGD